MGTKLEMKVNRSLTKTIEIELTIVEYKNEILNKSEITRTKSKLNQKENLKKKGGQNKEGRRRIKINEIGIVKEVTTHNRI